jgi:predicted phage gp36 major capsid-like protein
MKFDEAKGRYVFEDESESEEEPTPEPPSYLAKQCVTLLESMHALGVPTERVQ